MTTAVIGLSTKFTTNSSNRRRSCLDNSTPVLDDLEEGAAASDAGFADVILGSARHDSGAGSLAREYHGSDIIPE